MPSGPRRLWNQVPLDANVSPSMNDFLTWVMTSLNQTQGDLTPPATPVVTTISQPNAVQIVWNEVANAAAYSVFETSSPSAPPGVPLTTVHANLGATSNSDLRASINDTVTRYYWVQAIDRTGLRSSVSLPAPGTALSSASTITSISQVPVNQGGVGGAVGGGGAIPGRGRTTQ